MSKGLSASYYIKSNKKRVSVLVISIAMYITMLYLVSYMLNPTLTTFKRILYDQSAIQQFIFPDNTDPSTDFNQKLQICVDRVKEETNVKDAYPIEVINIGVNAIAGEWGFETALSTSEKALELMHYYDAKLIEGRLPENPGEIILDKKICNNNDFKLNDKIKIEFTIVGIVESDYYFATGVHKNEYNGITVLSEGMDVDYRILCKDFDFETYVYDSINGKSDFHNLIESSIDSSYFVITIGSLLVLSICLIIVINMFFKDRHEEWCLYYSIGFSSQNIFFSTLRELILTFGFGILLAIIFTTIGATIMNSILIKPYGLLVQAIIPSALLSIAASLLFILGICQIPLSNSLRKIRTVDILEEDI